MPFRTLQRYAQTITAGVSSVGVATNASWVGDWLNIENITSLGFQVKLTGTGSPTGTWGLDISDDEVNPGPSANLGEMGATATTPTAAMTAANPAGTTANFDTYFGFDPCPRAKWARLKLTISGGGSASQLLKVGVSMFGGAP